MHRFMLLFVFALIVGLVPAMADTWAFSFDGPTIDASGWVTITGLQATAGAGTFTYNGGPAFDIQLVTGSGTSPSGKFLYTSQLSPAVDPQIPAYPPNPGILFMTPDGKELNMWYQSNTGSYYASGYGGSYFPRTDGWGEQGTFSLTNVPEPGAVSLLVTMLAGAVGMAGILKKKLT